MGAERALRVEGWKLPSSATLAEAAQRIEAGARLLLVLRENGELLGCVHPLEVRGALVAGRDPAERITEWVRTPTETVAAAGELEEALDARVVHDSAVPIVEGGRPVGVRVVERVPRPRVALVMAGGEGRRLRPLTETLPKPLLEVAGRSLLARAFDLLERHGVEQVVVSTHYLAEKIEAFVAAGGSGGLEVRCVREPRPLGTAGALGLLGEVGDEPIWVLNADVLTEVDLTAMMSAHLEARARVTLGTVAYQWQIPYGVVEGDGRGLRAVREKPLYRFETNAGVYVFAPEVLAGLDGNEPMDMVTLINSLAAEGRSVLRFPLIETWSDVGRPEDFERAQDDFA